MTRNRRYPDLGNTVQRRAVGQISILGGRNPPVVTLKVNAGPDLQLRIELRAH